MSPPAVEGTAVDEVAPPMVEVFNYEDREGSEPSDTDHSEGETPQTPQAPQPPTPLPPQREGGGRGGLDAAASLQQPGPLPPQGEAGRRGEPDAAAGLQPPPDVPIVAQARRCTFEQFVNRFSPEEAGYAIEYLEAGTELGLEMAKEVGRRRLAKVKGYEGQNAMEYKSRRFDGGLSSGTWLQAVRIQSPMVLKTLAEVTGYNWGTEPHTFMRPFGHLIHFHPQIKQKLAALKAASPEGEGTDTSEEDALDHLQCYVSFVDEHLMPLVDQFADANHSNPKRIRYEDLWYLFKPGDLIYLPRNTLQKMLRNRGHTEAYPESAIYQTIWRLEIFWPHEGDLELPMIGNGSSDWEAKTRLYFVDYDGTAYKPVSISVTMDHFDGEKDIRTLNVFPIRFAPDHEALIEKSMEWGERFTQCIEQRHVSYKAWTLQNEPLGWKYMNNNKGRPVTSPEFTDGDVIIDFQEAFNAHPAWKYSYGLAPETWSSDVLTTRDKFPILLWSDASRSKLLSEWINITVSDDDIDFLEGKDFGKKHPYGQNGVDKPPKDDLVLLPRRLLGYGLHERRFLFLDVDKVKIKREADFDPFDFLEIDPTNKHIIHCLLTDHFNTKEARKKGEIASQDPIPGKGNNLVFLLHGPPGVGKTATVEAVAQKYRRPLFAITSGDLGSTPDAVESSLTEIFHLANVWDCILLLDEADVFLEEREKSDLKRNAVVSGKLLVPFVDILCNSELIYPFEVFLRVMEYYNGVLFLTTNRPGQLDEAIKSRVHSALLYQTLSQAQTEKVFRMNIKRLEYIEMQREKVQPDSSQPYLQPDKTGILEFAEKHWKEHEYDELGRWNGRQIRNAFISAAALARGDVDNNASDGRPSVTVLTERHFQGVAKSITAFDKYMARARGALDSERARTREDRPSPDEDPETGRNRRPSRNPGLSRPSLNHLGAAPQTPTPSRHYTQPPVSPSPSYYVQPAPQPSMPVPGQQPYGSSYAYPTQMYGTSPGASMPVWPQSVQQAGVQGPPPAVHSPPHAQQYPAMALQGGSDAGLAVRQGPPQPHPPRTPDGSGSQQGHQGHHHVE
ncbi:hypothetical protein F5144DRAFT_86373 [Chaetomium tenue]|uniref:Uncharacterized protein n=1 Tax=Chaetomium tenue TaxID=1854479 RepID=A0ACB7PF28_9PEZI|nr:hypothetical protein F5144DRAFT_86373 [Chaetomium globosum]